MVAIFSMQYVVLEIFYCLHIVLNCNSHQFNLYHTNHLVNGFSRDCLYYFISDDVTVPQFIQYCIRSLLDEIPLTKSPHYHHSFTFEELHKQNISSYQLYTWSAPIDLIEHYQIYLDKNSSKSDLIFYNCTYPWFGTYCEYSFNKDRTRWSFVQQVQFSFAERLVPEHFLPESLPCYTHLICDRAGDYGKIAGACLDWREICDGKINCINSGNDEEHCWQLEINECDPQKEFRCHNGLCIPLAFLNDDIHNPDCLDGSDEYVGKVTGGHAMPETSDNNRYRCQTNPAFKCEEHTLRSVDLSGGIFACGDGVKSDVLFQCFNGRDQVLMKAMIAGANMSSECRYAFECVTGVHSLYDAYNNKFYEDCEIYRNQYVMTMKQDCPPLIEFAPIIFGVVRFVYSNNASQVSENE